MKDWERIRDARPDITDYVIHWVRPKYEAGKLTKPFIILVDIVESGYLKPTFASRSSIYDKSHRPTIKGPYPAACFTEQSLDCFVKSCRVLPSHYHPYGIALNKRALFQYGGRPAIYGSEDMLGTPLGPSEVGYETGKEVYRNGLPKDCQYLWVRYQPLPNPDGYVVDWTHEREWRCLVATYHDAKLGNTPQEGIPLLLPAVFDHERGKPVYYLPKILVRSKEEQETVGQVIKELSPTWTQAYQSKYLKGYFELLPKVNVIALNELENDPEAVKLDWAILEK
jgi:hypothetical protein